MMSTVISIRPQSFNKALLFPPVSRPETPAPARGQHLQYEDCEPGRRIIHETYGTGVIVRRSAQLVHIRPDGYDYNVLAFTAQLRTASVATRTEGPLHCQA